MSVCKDMGGVMEEGFVGLCELVEESPIVIITESRVPDQNLHSGGYNVTRSHNELSEDSELEVDPRI